MLKKIKLEFNEYLRKIFDVFFILILIILLLIGFIGPSNLKIDESIFNLSLVIRNFSKTPIEVNKLDKFKKNKNFLSSNENILKKNGRIKNFHENDLNKSSASIVINGELFKLYFDQDVDLNMIKTTLEKKITKINEEMKKIDTRLSNKSFMDRAPQNIVDQEKSNFANLEKVVKKIELTLKGL